MHSLKAYIYFSIPMGLGVAFLLWVLWSFWQEEQRAKAASREIQNNSNAVRSRIIVPTRSGGRPPSTWG